MPDEIAMGKNPEQLPVFIRHDRGAGAHSGHRFQHVANLGIGRDKRQRLARPHDLMDAHEQTAPDHSRRDEIWRNLPSEIRALPASTMASASPSASMTVVLEVGARFSGHASCSTFTSRKTCAFLRQGRIGVAAHRDDFDLKPRDRRQNPQQFLGLAARAQRQNDIAVRDHAEIAVQAR